ncbi:MAG: hypothetical protein ACYT04_51380 [Nostoc sp.]
MECCQCDRCPCYQRSDRLFYSEGDDIVVRFIFPDAIFSSLELRAIAYYNQKVMILSSDSSSLMLFFPRLNEERCPSAQAQGKTCGGKLRNT